MPKIAYDDWLTHGADALVAPDVDPCETCGGDGDDEGTICTTCEGDGKVRCYCGTPAVAGMYCSDACALDAYDWEPDDYEEPDSYREWAGIEMPW